MHQWRTWSIWRKKQNGGCQGLKGGEMGCYYIMGTEFRFAGRSRYYGWTVVLIPTMGMYLMISNSMFKMVKTAIRLGCFIIIVTNHYIFGHWYIIAHRDGKYLKMKETLDSVCKIPQRPVFNCCIWFCKAEKKNFCCMWFQRAELEQEIGRPLDQLENILS